MDAIAASELLARSTTLTSVGWIGYIIIGAIAGWIAGTIVKGGGSGILMNSVIGIIGGFSGGGIGSFLLGIVSVLIGLLLLGSPMTATLAVPFVFGILLLIEGVALIIYAFRVKR